MPTVPDVLAAGAVVRRKGREVLLIHRPRYDDWSFPKGKLDPGEHPTAAAVRETGEETGLRIRLGPPLPAQRYPVTGGRSKTVHYWIGRVLGRDDVSDYPSNDEIDQVAWVPRDQAERLLTHARDRATLRAAFGLPRRSRALVVLRHGAASPRKTWNGDDRLRPLAPEGERQARDLVPLLSAFDVRRVVSSSSTRCRQTVAPYSRSSGRPVEAVDGLSEEDATARSVTAVVDDLVRAGVGGVLCGHRPVLPSVFDALAVPTVALRPAGMLVVHHREGRVLSTEVHEPA